MTSRQNQLFAMFFLILIFFACSNPPSAEVPRLEEKDTTGARTGGKPPSSFQDTLELSGKVAVFYEPDSLQLAKIKSITEEWIFNGSMHEYEYQFKNAKNILVRDWPAIKIITARNVRYLLFRNSEGKLEWIDLDKHNDPYGLILFDGKKTPVSIEMTNAGSLIPDYFRAE